MQQTPDQLLEQVKQYFEGKKFKEIIDLLNDELLDKHNDAVLYAWRARAHQRLAEFETALAYVDKSMAIDPSVPFSYFVRGNVWSDKGEYDKAIEDFNSAIASNKNHVDAYNNRGRTWHLRREYDKAIEDFNSAIALDKNYVVAYNNRGIVWYYKEEYDKAIEDFNSAIALDKNYAMAYNNRGLIWYNNKEYDKAIEDFNSAIALDKNYAMAYNNRGTAWSDKKDFDKAIEDYKNYIKLTKDSKDYYTKAALSKIGELEKEKSNKWYAQITEITQKIKELLLFKERCITHYTSLSATKFMLLQSSKFRISEGAFLNDTSEGRALVSFLDFNIISAKPDKTLAEPFAEKPFIGSFVADTKHDDLTLWRMYGKENQIEAKGCALTLNKDSFITAIQQQITGGSNPEKTMSEDFQFYSVAYINKDRKEKFFIPGNEDKEEELNKYMQELREKVQKLDADKKIAIAEQLNSITYLFKSSDYEYEQEVRLIVQGAGFNKTIDINATPPRVYIELTEITPSVTKITLGPKVDRADEWASAFNYHIRQAHSFKPEIIISHLPFK